MGIRFLLPILLAITLLLGAGITVASAEQCGREVRDELVSDSPPVSLTLGCDLTLEEGDRLTTRIVIEGPEASGLTLDCGKETLDGGRGTPNAGRDMIQVRSVLRDGSWSRPADVTIRNCNIIGSMRILGMGGNGEAAAVRESSRKDQRMSPVSARRRRRGSCSTGWRSPRRKGRRSILRPA